MARTVIDTGLVFQALKGTAVQGIAPAGGRLVFGVPRPYFFDSLDPAARSSVESALSRLHERGHAVQDVTIEHAAWTADVYLHIVLPEASRYHARGLEEHPDKYSPGIRLRLEMGRYLLAEDYVRPMRLRQALTRAVDHALERCDALVLPTLPIPAPRIGATTVDVNGVQAPVRATMLRLTQLFDITGHPAIALPAGRGPDGLPRSVQLVGHRGRTERLLDIAAAFEEIIR
jgi:aspartyl-tRNA(Asn)/glutamyl-tRNA(Gln) amidotransferase subunit A